VKIVPSPTIQRVAGAPYAWATLNPTTSAAYVTTAGIRQENISPTTNILRVPFYLPADFGKRFEVDFVVYNNQEVYVFWVLLFGCHGTQQCNTPDAVQSGNGRHKPENL
jgi:hypothetical protein